MAQARQTRQTRVAFRLRFALAIYAYTLDDPGIYTVINRVMFDPARGVKGAAPGKDLSPRLLACAPYIKLLDEALARLPAAFVFQGRVQRGVKWVYPHPDRHDPLRHFKPGAELTWYEFKSSSQKTEVMSQPQVGRSPLLSTPPPPPTHPHTHTHPRTHTHTHTPRPPLAARFAAQAKWGLALTSLLQFCGHEAGPRTIFTVDATCAYDISAFSFYGEEEAEVRTWPRPSLQVHLHARRRASSTELATCLRPPHFSWPSPFPTAPCRAFF